MFIVYDSLMKNDIVRWIIRQFLHFKNRSNFFYLLSGALYGHCIKYRSVINNVYNNNQITCSIDGNEK